jgi:hypothetical protein
MLKTGLVIFVGLFLFSCGSPTAKKTSGEVKTEVEEPIEARDLVKEYKEYLSSLDSTNEKSVTLATEKYEELFSGSNEILCDSAFMVFDKLYGDVENNLNGRLESDESLFDFPCIIYDSLGIKEEPFDKRFIPFRKSIEKNGFRIECPEGMTQIAQNRLFLKTRFYKSLSPLMKEFLEGVRKERDEFFTNDAGITISAEDYVDRLVWWDEFNRKHSDFMLSEKAKANQIVLFTYFLIGMDNTPVIGYSIDENGVGKTGGLDVYFASAYAYLSKKYPTSPLNALVKPYKMAILKNDNAKRERLIKTYTKRGLMIDFSKGFDWDLL